MFSLNWCLCRPLTFIQCQDCRVTFCRNKPPLSAITLPLSSSRTQISEVDWNNHRCLWLTNVHDSVDDLNSTVFSFSFRFDRNDFLLLGCCSEHNTGYSPTCVHVIVMALKSVWQTSFRNLKNCFIFNWTQITQFNKNVSTHLNWWRKMQILPQRSMVSQLWNKTELRYYFIIIIKT